MKSTKILIFTAFVIILLSVVCAIFPENGVAIGNKRLFFPSFEEIFIKEKSQSVAEKMQKLEAQIAFNDSVKAAHDDSLRFFKDFFANSPARIYFPDNDSMYLKPFFDALDSIAPQKTVHILHYGDSQIESDRITGFLRHLFQQRFGGTGPGLLPIVQPIPSFTVGQEASGAFERYIISGNLVNKAPHNRYGVLGQFSQLAGYGSIYIQPRKTKDVFSDAKTFSQVRLFVGKNSAGFEAKLKTGNNFSSAKTIKEAGDAMKILTWQLPAPAKKLTVQFSGSAELTAISLDSEKGVAVDNIPLRGSSGTFFTDIDASSIQPALKELDAQLILLEFGGNAVPSISNEKSVENYRKNIARQIIRWRTIYPDAKIVFIGPSDMSKRVNGKLQTYPLLPEIVESLKAAATENGAAFWNMYETMGGWNSMIDWVKDCPALASTDYIHFTPKGATRIAELLFGSLMIYYDYYTFIKNEDTE
jgi:lysophospholipase L1-like esterase